MYVSLPITWDIVPACRCCIWGCCRFSYMATSGVDRKLKIWDIRKFEMVHSYQIGCGAGNMAFSQTGALAVGKGNIVEVRTTDQWSGKESACVYTISNTQEKSYLVWFQIRFKLWILMMDFSCNFERWVKWQSQVYTNQPGILINIFVNEWFTSKGNI